MELHRARLFVEGIKRLFDEIVQIAKPATLHVVLDASGELLFANFNVHFNTLRFPARRLGLSCRQPSGFGALRVRVPRRQWNVTFRVAAGRVRGQIHFEAVLL